MSVLRMSRRMVKLSALPAARLLWFLAPACAMRQTLHMASTAVQRAGEHQNSVHNIGAGAGAQDMDLAAWSRLKNSEVGEAISPRLTKIGAWRPDPQPKFQVNEVSGLTPGVPAAVVQGVLSEQECKELIAGFPSGGQGFMPGQRVAELYRDRKVKSRSLVNDELLARILQERLREVLPQQLDGGRLFSVNPNFRFVHYDTGGRHSTHIDGREPVMPRWDEAAEGWVQSRLTMQIYLNSHGKDFEGGTARVDNVHITSLYIYSICVRMSLDTAAPYAPSSFGDGSRKPQVFCSFLIVWYQTTIGWVTWGHPPCKKAVSCSCAG